MRMTDTPYDAAMTRSKQELARQVVDCNARIEALEAALEDAQIEVRNLGNMGVPALKARIEALEAALRRIAFDTYIDYRSVAHAALAPEQDR